MGPTPDEADGPDPGSTAGAEAASGDDPFLATVTAPTATEPAIGDVFLSHVTDVVVVFSRDGTILQVNDWTLRHLGYRRDEVVGRSIAEFVHPDEVAAAFSAMERATDPDRARTFETARYRIRYRDGTHRELWLNGAYAPPTATRPACWVLSARRSSDMEVFDELLELLTEGAPTATTMALVPLLGDQREPELVHAVFHADDEGGATTTGRPVLDEPGDPDDPTTLLGHLATLGRFDGPADALPAPFADQVRSAGYRSLASATVHDPLFGRPAVVLVATPEGSPPHVTVYSMRQMVRALGLILRSRERTVRLHDAVHELQGFLADASHELRTPLTAILGYADLHRAGVLDEPAKVHQAFDRIQSEATRLLDLIQDLLLLARLGRHRPVAADRVELAPIVTAAVADGRAATPDRTISLHAPAQVAATGDEQRIRQVLANLLNNAQRHTPDGTPIEVVVADGAEATITVTDHGPGLPAHEVDLVFDRFWRSRDGADGGAPGRGLGLAIASSLAHAIGGRISVRSDPGAGTSFTLHLLRWRDDLAAADDDPTAGVVGPLSSGRP